MESVVELLPEPPFVVIDAQILVTSLCYGATVPASQNLVKTKNTHSQRQKPSSRLRRVIPDVGHRDVCFQSVWGRAAPYRLLPCDAQPLKPIPRTSHDLEFSRRQQLQQNPCTCRPLGQPTSCIGTYRRKLPPQGPLLRQTSHASHNDGSNKIVTIAERRMS